MTEGPILGIFPKERKAYVPKTTCMCLASFVCDSHRHLTKSLDLGALTNRPLLSSWGQGAVPATTEAQPRKL